MSERANRWTAPQVLLPTGGEGRARLAQNWTVVVGGWYVRVPQGYATDGATGPRWRWPVCGHPLEAPRVYAALVHDYLYEYGRRKFGMSRADADMVYYRLLRVYGWGRFRAAVEWAALRLFGASHWRGGPRHRRF